MLAAAAHASTPDAACTGHARNLAANCTTCHAADSHDASPLPRLAGQTKAELLQKLHAFRTGERAATVMHQIARGYTEEQLELIATYFAAHP
nr:c-type cytochrome [Aromatoleum diolicum]